MSTYYKYTSKARMDKSVNSLLGILEGIAIDVKLNDKEVGYLASWLIEHQEYASKHPFNELLPKISVFLQDNIITFDEHEELVWLCEKFRSNTYYSENSADLQRLQSILVGISADNTITEDELLGLSDWMAEHEHLRKCYPYDEVDSLILSTLADHKIDEQEHRDLLSFFQDFSETKPKDSPSNNHTITGICAADPVISFPGSIFCFTGESNRLPRNILSKMVMERGGDVTRDVSKKTNYLIVGAAGNPCWKYACYGLKIEKAIEIRKDGYPLLIVHENDFHDALG